jgi:hypothetical protein
MHVYANVDYIMIAFVSVHCLKLLFVIMQGL